jgi:arylsulfatase A-like enzyme
MALMLSLSHATTPPNVLVIVADDLGYNDISWHNPDIISPNLDKLAKDGIILESHYVLHCCSPTRAALMTGYYPIHTGRQSGVIKPEMPKGLYTNFTLMSQYFKDIGYRTHALGKWHLGFCNENYLPTRRGFDTFYGFYVGAQHYYTHLRNPDKGDGTPGYDFRDQEEVDYAANGTYNTILLAERAVKLIGEHAENYAKKPMFMYLPFQSVHGPLEVPVEYKELYPDIKNHKRRVFSSMVSAMDDAVGMIVEELENTGLLKNTILLFTSDNGGPYDSGANNYPLRGSKGTLWEGGTRASAFVYSSMFENKGTINRELIHVVDWIPTLLAGVKGQLTEENKAKVERVLSEGRDGIDQWSMLMGDEPSKRNELLYNIDPNFDDDGFEGHGAIRIDDLKLIVGNPGDKDEHRQPDTMDYQKDKGKEQLLDSQTNKEKLNPYITDERAVFLYNVVEDPYENNNIAPENQDIVERMKVRLQEYQSSMIPPHTAAETTKGNPSNFGGVWSPGWCESEPNQYQEVRKNQNRFS